jgi:hypothetical protein
METEMAMSGHRPGGGIASRVNVSPQVRVGTGSRGTRPTGVAQIGNMVGDHATHVRGSTGYTGERLHNDRSFQPVKFGNEVALNVGKGGCGTGRTIYRTGSQDQHGDVAGSRRPTGRDILNNE